MTPSLIRGRPRRSRSHLSVRVAHALLGMVIAVVWLVLPWMTINDDAPVAGARAGAAAPAEDESSGTDLVLPVAALVVVVVLAAWGSVRRMRRTRGRTTPAAAGTTHVGVYPSPAATPPLADLDDRSRAALVDADNRLRALREELAFAEALSGPEAVAPLAGAAEAAEAELAAACAIRRRYDEGVPEGAAALAGVVGRCEEAERRVTGAAESLRAVRGLEHDPAAALACAETRFRELTARTAEVGTAPADDSVTGYVELAKDSLVAATVHLNQTHLATASERPDQAAGRLRAAETAIARADVLVTAVTRLRAARTEAARLIPPALTGAEAELAPSRDGTTYEGETYARLLHADAVLAAVRRETTSGQPYDPLGVLRRIVHATAPLAAGRSGVLPVAALLVARESLAAADDYVTVHREAVGAAPRVLLSEARLTDEPARADVLAREARDLAERDVRLRGHPA
ncbi:hypothetical protein M2164_003200 [Streptomyces sp. SAI-208]|uniref:hypothetical protein n=1 Tax=Streptomyces sp. SAI-208 TaxID=2940550 RepID=UPI00247640AD|nr:hypothetical protein [Streptomyces sp. SAI-208]MDH6607565.1 hypothetical protein [Streptomyces sp. SAI-208]